MLILTFDTVGQVHRPLLERERGYYCYSIQAKFVQLKESFFGTHYKAISIAPRPGDINFENMKSDVSSSLITESMLYCFPPGVQVVLLPLLHGCLRLHLPLRSQSLCFRLQNAGVGEEGIGGDGSGECD